MKAKWFNQFIILRTVLGLIFSFLFFLFLSHGSQIGLPFNVQAQNLDQKLKENAFLHRMEQDTADVTIEYTSVYPGEKSFLVTVLLKNPVEIAGFDFEITFTPEDLADFSTVRIYVDSMDTCPAPEETCWYYYPVRECLIVPGHLIADWTFLEAHGEAGDTSQPKCDRLWALGLAFNGTPIPPQSNYVTLFKFGVDVVCVSDSLPDRTIRFDMTGHLSDPQGQLVPLRTHYGEITLWWSVPGDANNDSLVDVGDIVFLINYLFKNGQKPCVMEAGDANADCVVDVGDVVYLINFLFREGSPPEPGCAH